VAEWAIKWERNPFGGQYCYIYRDGVQVKKIYRLGKGAFTRWRIATFLVPYFIKRYEKDEEIMGVTFPLLTKSDKRRLDKKIDEAKRQHSDGWSKLTDEDLAQWVATERTMPIDWLADDHGEFVTRGIKLKECVQCQEMRLVHNNDYVCILCRKAGASTP
jgi:hypothetical protein